MLKINVSKSGGDFSTLQEAVDAVPYEEQAEILIGEGEFFEKIFCEKKDITLVGAGIDKTIINFDDCANEIMPDGSKRGTFRSYTAFFGGKRVCVKDLTIKNSAGDGRKVGQAVAVYADADVCMFENVKLTACQDTLFCAPLPVTERQKNGFMGPRVVAKRRLTRQYYKNCVITGDVDFIFGGADAVFDGCDITCNDRLNNPEMQDEKQDKEGKLDKDQIDTTERQINGYITAACGVRDNIGFIFRNCMIRGEKTCEKASVFLGRPWRDEARTVFINCTMDDTVAPERFSGWGGITKDQPDTFYGEFGTKMTGTNDIIDLSGKNSWVRDIDESLAKELLAKADEIVKICSERK